MEYTKAVGTKFHPDGSLRCFPGNTIVSHTEESSRPQLIWVQERYNELSFASRKLAFLPPSSI